MSLIESGRDREISAQKERFLDGINLVVFDRSGVVSDDRKTIYEADMRSLEGSSLEF